MLFQKPSVRTPLWQMWVFSSRWDVGRFDVLSVAISLCLGRYLRPRVHDVVGVEGPLNFPHEFDLCIT